MQPLLELLILPVCYSRTHTNLKYVIFEIWSYEYVRSNPLNKNVFCKTVVSAKDVTEN